jgi:hypothetical protein
VVRLPQRAKKPKQPPAKKAKAVRKVAQKKAPAKKKSAIKKTTIRTRARGRPISGMHPTAIIAKEKAKKLAAAVARQALRPDVEFSAALGREICRRIANGEAISSIIKSEGMPRSRGTLVGWALDPDKEEYSRAFFLAQETAAYVHADDLHNINRHLLTGRVDPQSARVISENLRWAAGVQSPKRFGKNPDIDELLRKLGGAGKLTIEFVGASGDDSGDITRS